MAGAAAEAGIDVVVEVMELAEAGVALSVCVVASDAEEVASRKSAGATAAPNSRSKTRPRTMPIARRFACNLVR
jgi:hypothetical protein